MIESVPNVSEGARLDVVAELADAVRVVPGVYLLDYSADPSHNRSVFTLAGSADAVCDALLSLFERALARIDLRRHRGVHPRLGAVDVVPFIPLGDASMAECVEWSRAFGATVSTRFGVPIYLYEESARHPGRRRLEDIRRGQFEGLADKMQQPGWAPDYGPAAPHDSAGATVVGARRPLVAFNVNLDVADVRIARDIASAVRERGGGLPCVKALGLALAHRGVAQVSMNLTDFTQTSVQQAFDEVQRQAERRGAGVLESELIGLIPQAALGATTPARLKLRNFSRSQILEERIAALAAAG
ncbi:MAG TPA: glutamate formimidoyltransferase [Vicinamibacterales bacterium]|nr:glutamate formimidoyltransferase [Vicinamibacterales bacterium]